VAEWVPAPQKVHVVDDEREYFPELHSTEKDAPTVLEYLPAPHTVQDVADNPNDEYVPAAHAEQAVDELADV
jgi:hypothetical protein